ncbi:hypothetical protein M3665_25025, partial [Bacillus licheniformis]|nr:hypothetical protein [Bacillus licheniformis]
LVYDALPDGTYTVSASYTNSAGTPQAATTLAAATVQSVVKQADGTAGLVLSNGTTVGLTQVASIFPNTKSSTSGDTTTN